MDIGRRAGDVSSAMRLEMWRASLSTYSNNPAKAIEHFPLIPAVK